MLVIDDRSQPTQPVAQLFLTHKTRAGKESRYAYQCSDRNPGLAIHRYICTILKIEELINQQLMHYLLLNSKGWVELEQHDGSITSILFNQEARKFSISPPIADPRTPLQCVQIAIQTIKGSTDRLLLEEQVQCLQDLTSFFAKNTQFVRVSECHSQEQWVRSMVIVRRSPPPLVLEAPKEIKHPQDMLKEVGLEKTSSTLLHPKANE